MEQDKKSIDQLTKNFFGIFANKNGATPNWDLIGDLCLPELIVIKKEKEKQEIYNLESFIAPRKTILSNRTLQDFSETEITERTTIIGNIAQRSSRYYKEGKFKGDHFEQYGNKLFQFIKTENGWRINAVIWEDEMD